MGKTGTRLPSFCLNRIKPHARVRSPPVHQQSKPNNANSAAKNDEQKSKEINNSAASENKLSTVVEEENNTDIGAIKRKIMIVVDSSFEAKAALLWALSHTVQTNDLLILLHVTNPSRQATGTEESTSKEAPRAYALVNSLKSMSQLKRPEIQIETTVVEGKEKGALIVEEAKKQGVALLVLGQRKRSMTWRLIMMWASNKVTSGAVEYCIQNADCMAIAIRRKNKKHGGYLITTKRHRDFWLLA
ncbi:universal stress protein PHOS32 isoform X2 [Mercurialis annua]|uniref:universal stress protein PHOS32 isoform X2 n=1 Tax=Mercurialis annua TaxID=3986 RepID=UPI00215EE87F|nr:universal stress protein PHOS32 isoform X2 [Mercurialis annua]